MEKKQKVELIKMLATAYPHFLPDTEEEAKAKTQLWSMFMDRWEYEPTKERIIEHIESNVFEPRIAEIKPGQEKQEPSLREKLEEAYGREIRN